MKKNLYRVVIFMLFLSGLSLLLYPLIANMWNERRQERLVGDYESKVAELESTGSINYDREWEQARLYNDALNPIILPDSFAIAESKEEEDADYISCLNLTGDGMMGQIEIPKIDVKIPIYHTTDAKVLEHAAGHLEGSSLPVGGADTHAVISAHRGLPSALLFTDLDKLEEGDRFLIHVLDDTLCYEVDQISVVEPADTSQLAVVDGGDMVTLLTCTPYGVNTHRLLVRGTRVPYDPIQIQEQEVAGEIKMMSIYSHYEWLVLSGLFVTGLFVVMLFVQEKAITEMRRKEKRGRS